jgi:chromosome segregation ATPase
MEQRSQTGKRPIGPGNITGTSSYEKGQGSSDRKTQLGARSLDGGDQLPAPGGHSTRESSDVLQWQAKGQRKAHGGSLDLVDVDAAPDRFPALDDAPQQQHHPRDLSSAPNTASFEERYPSDPDVATAAVRFPALDDALRGYHPRDLSSAPNIASFEERYPPVERFLSDMPPMLHTDLPGQTRPELTSLRERFSARAMQEARLADRSLPRRSTDSSIATQERTDPRTADALDPRGLRQEYSQRATGSGQRGEEMSKPVSDADQRRMRALSEGYARLKNIGDKIEGIAQQLNELRQLQGKNQEQYVVHQKKEVTLNMLERRHAKFAASLDMISSEAQQLHSEHVLAQRRYDMKQRNRAHATEIGMTAAREKIAKIEAKQKENEAKHARLTSEWTQWKNYRGRAEPYQMPGDGSLASALEAESQFIQRNRTKIEQEGKDIKEAAHTISTSIEEFHGQLDKASLEQDRAISALEKINAPRDSHLADDQRMVDNDRPTLSREISEPPRETGSRQMEIEPSKAVELQQTEDRIHSIEEELKAHKIIEQEQVDRLYYLRQDLRNLEVRRSKHEEIDEKLHTIEKEEKRQISRYQQYYAMAPYDSDAARNAEYYKLEIQKNTKRQEELSVEWVSWQNRHPGREYRMEGGRGLRSALNTELEAIVQEKRNLQEREPGLDKKRKEATAAVNTLQGQLDEARSRQNSLLEEISRS